MKLVELLLEEPIFIPRKLKERDEDYKRVIYRQIQEYIKNGSKGDLNLSGAPITSLPDNLTRVGGNLYLRRSSITSLPDNLKVGGDLSLSRTPITSLPNNLEVGWSLFLSYTPITSLPSNLRVGGYLFLYRTPLSEKYTKGEITDIVERKGGYIVGGVVYDQ